MPDVLLGWDEHLDAAWQELGEPGAWHPGSGKPHRPRLSTILRHATDAEPLRVRNIGADVAVGDWVVVDEAVQRVAHVIGRRSAFVRRASHEGDRAEADVLAANIDVVFLVHALTAPPNQRRLERELVLAFDSGAQPQIVLTKSDVADDIEATVDELRAVAAGVPVHIASGITRVGLEPIRAAAEGGRTLAFFGASGVGKSTLVNSLIDAKRWQPQRYASTISVVGTRRWRHNYSRSLTVAG